MSSLKSNFSETNTKAINDFNKENGIETTYNPNTYKTDSELGKEWELKYGDAYSSNKWGNTDSAKEYKQKAYNSYNSETGKYENNTDSKERTGPTTNNVNETIYAVAREYGGSSEEELNKAYANLAKVLGYEPAKVASIGNAYLSEYNAEKNNALNESVIPNYTGSPYTSSDYLNDISPSVTNGKGYESVNDGYGGTVYLTGEKPEVIGTAEDGTPIYHKATTIPQEKTKTDPTKGADLKKYEETYGPNSTQFTDPKTGKTYASREDWEKLSDSYGNADAYKSKKEAQAKADDYFASQQAGRIADVSQGLEDAYSKLRSDSANKKIQNGYEQEDANLGDIMRQYQEARKQKEKESYNPNSPIISSAYDPYEGLTPQEYLELMQRENALNGIMNKSSDVANQYFSNNEPNWPGKYKQFGFQ